MKALFLLTAFFLLGCSAFGDSLNTAEPHLSVLEIKALDNFSKRPSGIDPLTKKYIINIIYLGMREEEFVELFTWEESFEETVKPYITKKKDNIYYIRVPYIKAFNKKMNTVNREKERVTFEDGKLVKYESQYREKFPFMFLVWSDDTDFLDGYPYTDGLYRGMPEAEFLNKFPDYQVIDMRKYNMTGFYSILTEKKKEYHILFKDGKLDNCTWVVKTLSKYKTAGMCRE